MAIHEYYTDKMVHFLQDGDIIVDFDSKTESCIIAYVTKHAKWIR